MAKHDKGILGRFIGKVGTIIGGTWRGIDYMRSKGPSTRNNKSPLQLEQQAKFAVAVQFAKRLKKLFSVTFKPYAKKMTARNSALIKILKEAVTGTYPSFNIDYSKVMISQGSLENVDSPVMSATQSGTLNWRWTDNTGVGDAERSDTAIIVAYCPERKQCVYNLHAATRDQGTANLAVPMFSGKDVYTWIAFISEDNKRISDSVYTGTLMAI